VTITLEPGADGTIVRLVHDGLTQEQAASHGEGWNHYLAAAGAAAANAAAAATAATALEPRVAVAAQAALEAWNARGLDGMVKAAGNELPAVLAVGILSIELPEVLPGPDAGILDRLIAFTGRAA
jgi:Activator of Hsp90 ATPase homolog 1-like protein